MVELGVQIKGSDTTEKGTDGTKDTHQVTGVDNEDRRKAASKLEKEKAALVQHHGSEVARETEYTHEFVSNEVTVAMYHNMYQRSITAFAVILL